MMKSTQTKMSQTQQYADSRRQKYNRYLLPYDTIAAATVGDSLALYAIHCHFEPYINALSRRTLRTEDGQSIPYYDPELQRLLHTRLITATLQFKLDFPPNNISEG